MSLWKYHAILDDGRRCQSCCNRCQLFGSRDVDSGWEGDCGQCVIRWYRHQIRCVSRNYLPAAVSIRSRIYRYAGLDLSFERLARSVHRKLEMWKSRLTNVVDSDDEYFYSDIVTICPLTLLDDVSVNPRLETIYFRGLPNRSRSLLDCVALFLLKLPKTQHLGIPLSDTVFEHCTITRLQEQDYVFEVGWSTYQWQGHEWMNNAVTTECFWKESAAPWTAYGYQDCVWWLNGTRWFWER